MIRLLDRYMKFVTKPQKYFEQMMIEDLKYWAKFVCVLAFLFSVSFLPRIWPYLELNRIYGLLQIPYVFGFLVFGMLLFIASLTAVSLLLHAYLYLFFYARNGMMLTTKAVSYAFLPFILILILYNLLNFNISMLVFLWSIMLLMAFGYCMHLLVIAVIQAHEFVKSKAVRSLLIVPPSAMAAVLLIYTGIIYLIAS